MSEIPESPEVKITLILLLAMTMSMTGFAIHLYLPALPSIAKQLSASINQIEATVSFFILGFAVSQLFLGALSDKLGRVQVMSMGLLLFSAASFLCSFSQTAMQFQVLRFIQALGAGASVVVFPLINDMFDKQKSARLISLILATLITTPILAPIIGSQLLQFFSWQSIFYSLAIYALLGFILVQVFLKKQLSIHILKNKKMTLPSMPFFRRYFQILNNENAVMHILIQSFSFAGFFAYLTASPFIYIEYFGKSEQFYGYLISSGAFLAVCINLCNAKFFYSFPPLKKVLWGGYAHVLSSLFLLLTYVFDFGFYGVFLSCIFYSSIMSFTLPNTLASFLSKFKHTGSGVANSVLGFIQFSFCFLSSYWMSTLDSKDSKDMLLTMSGFAFLVMLSSLRLSKATKKLQSYKVSRKTLAP